MGPHHDPIATIFSFIPFLVIGVVALIPLFWVIAVYNGMIRIRNACVESWADIDTELKRRYDLIPNLVEVVKGYAAHERQVLEDVIAARSRALASTGSPASQARDEAPLVDGLKHLVAVAEAYPDLKADAHFRQLMTTLADTEDRIQAARRFYNANVRDLANRIEAFPSNLVASTFSITPRDYFQIGSAVERQAVAVHI
jgi:LemA protein